MTAKTPFISTDSEPVVGKFYLVQCIQSGSWILPVLGNLHSDIEIGIAKRHYHYDLRFLSDREIADLTDGMTLTRSDVPNAQILVIVPQPSDTFVTRRLKCRRAMPLFPIQTYDGRISPVARALEPLYAARTIDLAAPVCPHRKFPLAGLPVDEENCVVCPLHGLKWSLTTGAMVPRTAAECTETKCTETSGGPA